MAAPASPVGTMPTLTSGAADSTYNINLANIEHGESNLIGNAYGTTGEIGGTLGEQLTGVQKGLAESVGPNYAKTGILEGSLGRSQGERTRAESARAGANTQSGLYGTERANTLLGFAQRGAGIERVAGERTKAIQNRAREAWEKNQFGRANAILAANNRYQNYVNRNPGPAVVTAAGGGPPGTKVNTGPGSPGQPIRAGFNEAVAGGPGGIGGQTFGPNFVRVGRPPPRPRGRR